MEEFTTITEEEREKCQQVADAFSEYFDEMDDTTIEDTKRSKEALNQNKVRFHIHFPIQIQ